MGNHRKRLVSLGLSAAFLLAACADDGRGAGTSSPEKTPQPGAVERPAPALAADGTWVKGGPVDLAALREKKVVLLEVGFSSCKRCRSTIPYLTKWSQRYADKGLEVMFVNDGTVSPPLESVKGFVKEMGIPFAVLHDANGTTAKAYGVSAYPHVFLIDRRGGIAWDGSPVGKDAEVEQQIEKLLN
jgi:peroxiredoxin